MSSPVAAATARDGILLVQYSPTGNGIGDLYAIVLSDMKQPLPFQIQRQIPDLQALKGDVVSMSLASIPSFGGSNPTAPGAAPPGSSPAAAAVVAAPPFRDVVLSVNAASSTQAWHVKGPGRGVPPGSNYSNPLAPLWGASKIPSSYFPKATSISFGTHAPQGPKNPGILAVLRTSAGLQLTKLEYPPNSVNLGSSTSPSTQAPPLAPPSGGNGGNSNSTAAEPPIQWKPSWNAPASLDVWGPMPSRPGLIFHPTTIPESARGQEGLSEAVTGECIVGALDSWCLTLLSDPPSASVPINDLEMPPSSCFTSTSNALVAVADGKVYVNEFARVGGKWNLKNPNAPSMSGSVVACTTSNNVVIVVVPDSSGVQSRPEIHLFDLNTPTPSWAKAQLVPAPNGTFSDMPSPPPTPTPSPSPGNSNRPGKGDPGEGGGGPDHSDDPSTMDPSAANTTTSRAALIGGIVGGIVVLGALIFAGFFFSRRRGSKQKGQHRSNYALKPMDGDNGHHKEQRMHDSAKGSRVNVGNPGANNYQDTTRARAMPPMGYSQAMQSQTSMTGRTLVPTTGPVTRAGDKGEISEREAQTMRPPSANGSVSSFADDDSLDYLEIVTNIGRSRSNIRAPGQPRGNGTDAHSTRDDISRVGSITSSTARTEPVTPALAHAQLILQESQRRHPPVPPMKPLYPTYQSQSRRLQQQYP